MKLKQKKIKITSQKVTTTYIYQVCNTCVYFMAESVSKQDDPNKSWASHSTFQCQGYSVHYIRKYATTYMRSWHVEKIYFLFSEKTNFIIKSEWLIDFFHNIGTFVLVSPYRYLVVGTNEGALKWSSCSRTIFFDNCVLYFCFYFICHHCVKNIIL